MAFTIGQRVWFKRAGSTPFVTGDATSSKVVFDSSLGGRGEPSLTFSGGTIPGGGRLGIPGQPAFTATTRTKLDSGNEHTEHTVSGTFKFPGGESLGVKEKSLKNPLAPGVVTTDGIYDGPTSKVLFGNQDEAKTDSGTTLRTANPNYPTGLPNATSTTGTELPLSGTQEFVSEVVNVAGTTVGFRAPSSEEGAGVVVQIITGTVGSVSPDGTKLIAGTMYYVNWGASAVSNPHRAKWNNRFRVQLHAQEDLIAA